MNVLLLLLNLPWTLFGLAGALLSGPRGISFSKQPAAIIIQVKSFWWFAWVPGYKGVRAATWGNTVVEGPKPLAHDREHELIHVEQAMRRPFVHPFLYLAESLKHGNRNNAYEREAYQRTGNPYLEK